MKYCALAECTNGKGPNGIVGVANTLCSGCEKKLKRRFYETRDGASPMLELHNQKKQQAAERKRKRILRGKTYSRTCIAPGCTVLASLKGATCTNCTFEREDIEKWMQVRKIPKTDLDPYQAGLLLTAKLDKEAK